MGFENYSENKEKADALRKEIQEVQHGIGNLSLSVASANSSDSNGLPCEHLESYKKFGLVKTVEQIETWTNPSEFPRNIADRSESIREFVKEDIINIKDIWN